MAVMLAGLMLAIQVVSTDTEPLEVIGVLPELEDVEPQEAAPELSPREYLFATFPSIAKRMDCVISRESRWSPTAVNPRSKASGLAQFLPSTWRTTPQAAAGASVFDAFANIDAAAWLARTAGWRSWEVVTNGWC